MFQNRIEDIGWGKFQINIEKFYLIINEDYINSYHLTTGDSIPLPEGKHNFRIVWKNIDDYTGEVIIHKNQTTLKWIGIGNFVQDTDNSFEILENKYNLTITTDPKSEIYINQEFIGINSAKLLLNPGYYRVSIKNPNYGSLDKRIKIEPKEAVTLSRFNKNPNPIPVAKKLIPGLSYLYTKQYKKAVLTYSGLVLLTGASLYFNSEYNKKNNLFQSLNADYLDADTPERAIALRKQAQNTIQEMDKLNNKITAFTLGTIAWYTLTTFDGLRKPKDGYPGNIIFQPQFSFAGNTSLYPKVSLNINF